MKKNLTFLALSIALIIIGCNSLENSDLFLKISSENSVSPISPLIYGQFYEHIYHSANGGLWGDLVWNRSFEEFEEKPDWRINGDILSQTEKLSDVKLLIGNPNWTDYDFTLEARKDEGYEGFLVLFRATDEDHFYWLNAGGWGNSQHCIEKEVGGNRKVITPFIQGKIDQNTWIPIRVSVRGNRMEVFLNNKILYNYTDSIHPLLKGSVGIGSWSTSVSFRNLKVTDPDGKVLYNGLPVLPDNFIFPRHWAVSDPAKFTVDNKDAKNGSVSVVAHPAGSSISISQNNFAVKAGDVIQGSIWLKGSSSARVSVQLKEGHTLITESNINDLSSTWKEYPVTFDPQPATRNLQLFITIHGTGSVHIDQLSLMAESAIKNDGFRMDLYSAVKDIQPTVIRWPGGCFAELYRWKSGIGPQSDRMAFPVNLWDDKDVNSLGTDEYITLSRKLGSEPLIVINSGFHEGAGTPEAWAPWVQEACDWVEYCNGPASSVWGSVRARNGHPEPYGVKFWEIDNELWRSRVPDPHKYSQAVKIFAAEMRKIDPGITIIAHGGNGTDMEWNQVVLDECAGDFDILSIHHYSDPDGYFTAALSQDTLYKKLRKAISTCANPSVQIYVSEWNAQSTDWRTGMYAGNLLNIFEQNSDAITMGGPALFLRHTSATAWDNAFINFDQSGWFPAPNYVVMKLWREHYAPDRLDMTGMPDSVNAVASFDPADKRMVVKLVNNSQSDRALNILLPENYKGNQATGYLVRGMNLSDRNTMEQPDRIAPKNQPVSIKGQKIYTNLPALSCLLIEIR